VVFAVASLLRRLREQQHVSGSYPSGRCCAHR
jgi:hypothetical protein